MAEEKATNLNKTVSVDDLRHAEYYGMQKVFDELYAKSKNNDVFNNLMRTVLSEQNILLAYRNIKSNAGSKTPGTDGLTIEDIAKYNPEDFVSKVRYILAGSPHGYRPKPVKRVEIPKPNGGIRPLGIPCIWDRIAQQCIKQVLDPICEAKFSDNSYGFRPQRNVEQAIAHTYRMLQKSNLHYVVEIDIKSFFDNVNHSKLVKQMWSLGIHDRKLLSLIKQILQSPIQNPDRSISKTNRGTPQGGIISPILANICLNEFDRWIDSQWQVFDKISSKPCFNKNGSQIKSNTYKAMRKTNLKEVYIIRYADDIRLFCRTYRDAINIKAASEQWLAERLGLSISEEKTKIINVTEKYTEFLGFKIKLIKKGDSYVISSRMSDKSLERVTEQLVSQVKLIANPTHGLSEYEEIRKYNSMVMGIQNYYRIATNVSLDLADVQRSVMTVFTSRLQKGSRMKKHGYSLTQTEKRLYGASKMLRYVGGHPIYPIGYVKTKNPMCRKFNICCYTENGRQGLHCNLSCNVNLMMAMMKTPLFDNSIEFADNRLSLFSAQNGKCAITGKSFLTLDDIHCHHITPKSRGGTDKYENLVLMFEPAHRLIHATQRQTIDKLLDVLNLNETQLAKVNEFRLKVGNPPT